jgi:mediator of RNA polymerase II transcription subunit 14
MNGQRVAILDGSHSLFITDPPSSSMEMSRSPVEGLSLQPIPQFQEIVLDAVREVVSSGEVSGKIALIDVGVVCDADAVGALGRAMHGRILGRMR